MDLPTLLGTLEMSQENRAATLSILEREAVTPKQLLTYIEDEDLREIGLCDEAVAAIRVGTARAAEQVPSCCDHPMAA